MTAKQKLDMYKGIHSGLVDLAVKLQDFSENPSEFVDENPTAEQQAAGYDADQLTNLIGKYAVQISRMEKTEA